MKSFDLAEVRHFTADLASRMSRCDNGEGMECSTLEDTLLHYAALCCEYRENVRAWGRAVFSGEIEFDSEVERIWREEGKQLRASAVEVLGYGQKAEGPCYVLDGQAALQAALWNLEKLLKKWVTPKLAVSPSARQRITFSDAEAAEVKRRMDALPPLPVDWQPADPKQQQQLKMLQRNGKL
jgi:hypothetical protein